ncbi:MAG: type II toxin-antitoxin system antitoxin SocA domain-containing protein [Promethearchaeota archaeon]
MLTQKQLGLKIKELREKHELSQEKLSNLVGISRAALSELERGNRSLDALELAKIAKIFGLSTDEILKNKETKRRYVVNVNKKMKFEANKLRQLILYILSRCGGKPNFGETVLYKLLYFIDFDAYEGLGKPITGMNYIHQKFGPMPQLKQYQPVIQDMKENQEIKVFNQDYYGMTQKRYVALKNYKMDDFSGEEKELIDNVISHLSNLGARQIEEYAHGDIPWRSTEDNEIIPYDLVVYRKLPYAQCDYEQVWQEVAAKDTLKSLGKMSDKERDYYKNL